MMMMGLYVHRNFLHVMVMDVFDVVWHFDDIVRTEQNTMYTQMPTQFIYLLMTGFYSVFIHNETLPQLW